jgi:hypothetical protein
LHTIPNDVWRAADDQLAETWLRAGPAEIRMIPEEFDDDGDSQRRAFRRLRLVPCNISPDFLKPGAGQGRPYDL